jgi:hypothetical protein
MGTVLRGTIAMVLDTYYFGIEEPRCKQRGIRSLWDFKGVLP